jgi:hypothetical protein
MRAGYWGESRERLWPMFGDFEPGTRKPQNLVHLSD